jgi:xylulokinase
MGSLCFAYQAGYASTKNDRYCSCFGYQQYGEAGVLIDKDGKPLFPVLTWHDKRTISYRSLWEKEISSLELYQLTGLPFDHIYSVNKICWYRDQYPQIFPQARTWLSLADWIGFCLTGKRATSYSQACRTMLFDISNHTWSHKLLEMANISPDLMPPAYPSGYLLGKVLSLSAQQCGLPSGTPVALGGHDHICAAFAAGVFKEGIVLDSVGTSEAIMFSLSHPISSQEAADAGLCCGCHTVGEQYYLVGGIRSGAVMSWMGKAFANDSSSQSISLLIEEALSSPALANGYGSCRTWMAAVHLSAIQTLGAPGLVCA